MELAQPLGIGRVLAGHQEDAQPVAVGQDVLRPGQGLVRQGAAQPARQLEQLKLLLVGKVHRLRRAEPAQQGRGRLGAEPLPAGEPQEIG